MPQFPAFCANCGLIFPSRQYVFEGIQTLELERNFEDCPRCGAMAELPEGTFSVIGDTIEVLSATDLTRTRLARLAAILQAAEAGRISEDEAEQAVVEEAPELAPLFERFRPRMRSALIFFLLAVVQILAAQVLAEHRDESATRDDVRQAVEEAVERCRSAPP